MRVIPAIDLIQGRCVRLYRGDYDQQTVYSPDPVEPALKFQASGFRRLHLVDLEGARDGRGQNRPAIRRILKASRVPVQVGGGIRTAEDVVQLLGWGASFLILGTTALSEPQRVEEWIGKWGSEPFIVSLDLRGEQLQSQGWLQDSDVDLETFLQRIRAWGIRQVICTDVERDGTLQQPNWATYRRLRTLLSEEVALIAAGGVSSPEHIRELKSLGVDGAVVGRALYEGEFSWEEWLRAG